MCREHSPFQIDEVFFFVLREPHLYTWYGPPFYKESKLGRRPFIIMVIVEIETGLYDIMYRAALEIVGKEAKLPPATRNELKMGSFFRSEYVGSGEIENRLMRAANQ